MTVLAKNTRVYLGKVARITRDKQKLKCIEIAEQLELPKIYKSSYYEHNEVPAFINDLRLDEVAIVGKLESLAEIKGVGVGLRFLMNVMKIQDTSLLLVDAHTGLKSSDGDKWYEFIEATARSIMRGRPLGEKQARVMAEIRYEKLPGLEKAWKEKKGGAEYLAAAMIWGNLDIKPAEKAISMFADDELKAAAPITIRRIFGSRRDCLNWVKKQ